MTSISVIRSRKTIYMHQEDSTQFIAKQNQFPTYRPNGLEEASGLPLVCEEESEHLSRHQP